MKISRIIACCLLALGSATASAGVMTVYQDTGSMSANGSNANAFGPLSTSQTVSGGLLVDFSMTFTGVISGNDFMGIWFGYDAPDSTAGDRNLASDHTAGPNIGFKSQLNGSDLFVRTSGTEARYLAGGNVDGGATQYHVFGHLYKTAGSASYDRFDAWVNPTAAEIASLTGHDASAAGLSGGLTAINRFGIRTANLGTGESVMVSGLTLQAVPEPGTLALAAIALAGMAGLRRRKAA